MKKALRPLVWLLALLTIAMSSGVLTVLPVRATPLLIVSGTLTYNGRSGTIPFNSYYIELWHTSGLCLSWDYTDENGTYEFNAFENPGGVIYVKVYSGAFYNMGNYNASLMCLHQNGIDYLDAYIEPTPEYALTGNETTKDITYQINVSTSDDAFWIKDDLEDGFRWPVQHGGTWPPGSYIAEWEEEWVDPPFDPPNSSHYVPGEHIRINNTHAEGNPDIVLHEMGHNVMHNCYHALNPDHDCPSNPEYNAQYWEEGYEGWAWVEGWAEYWLLAVNNDAHQYEIPSWGYGWVINGNYEVWDAGAEVVWQKLDEWQAWAELSEGCYLLRSNINDWDAEQLWQAYIQLTEAEAAFRIHSDDNRNESRRVT